MASLSTYLLLKLLHILSSTLLFGTGLGTYFFMVLALRSAHREALRITTRTVVIADFLFTAPAAVIQPLTGWLLMQQLGIAWNSLWFACVVGLYLLVGALWLPVVAIQLQLRDLLQQLPADQPLPAHFWKLARLWQRMGYPAGVAMLALFALMVCKPFL